MAQSDGAFGGFDSLPEVLRTVVLIYVRFPLSLRRIEDIQAGRGINICHETVQFWWNRFGPMFACEIRRKRVQAMRSFSNWAGIWTRSSSGSTASATTLAELSTMKARFWNALSPGQETGLQP